MTTKTIFTILLLLPFCFLNAQDCPSEAMANTPLVFESVSFSAEQGSVTITCPKTVNLTHFEFIAEDTHYSFDWGGEVPARYFPMKLSFKPGEVTIKYKVKGEKAKTVELKIEADEALKLSI